MIDLDNRIETAIPIEHSPYIAPGAKYVKRANVRYRLPRKAFMSGLHTDAMLARIVRDCYGAAGDDVSKWLRKSPYLAYRLSRIEKIVTEILLFDEPGFSGKRDSYGRVTVLIENGVGRFYYDEDFRMGKVINGDGGATLDRYRVRPKVQLFLDVCARHAVGQYGDQYFAGHPLSRTPDGKQFLWESYNELLEMICREAKARGLDRQDIANTYRSTRAFHGMKAVVKRCFAKCPRIFVICLDVFYSDGWADKATVALAKRHHADFVNRLRGLAAIRKNLVGAIWKLDWHEAKGHYFRWVFMFDGNNVHGTWQYEDIVDELWKSVVGKSAGTTVLLNVYQHFAVGSGEIDVRKDHTKLEHLVGAIIRDLACKDQFLCIERKPGARTWGSLVPQNEGGAMAEATQSDDSLATADSTP
ncbi:hypothetical protein LA03_14010 [Burkholderia gladioli]|uniref:inovirus-type Gp2 protein n=1 Tax=Burkholderia gladioli TaxID=28095 RepID=UPI00050F336A|nr:inovirus-type Gp2 protein [Burkholderia gladioli]KGE09811.1 hypothetical protein LA03_14010 [Burkholderia gladioli]